MASLCTISLGLGRLPTLVSAMGDKKLLAVSKIPAGTGQAIAHPADSAIQKWGLENLIRSMCFDTISSNTGQLSGAYTILEQLPVASIL